MPKSELDEIGFNDLKKHANRVRRQEWRYVYWNDLCVIGLAAILAVGFLVGIMMSPMDPYGKVMVGTIAVFVPAMIVALVSLQRGARRQRNERRNEYNDRKG